VDEESSTAHADDQDNSRSELRQISVDYLRRTWSERIGIARRLGVLQDEDLQLPDTELFPLVLTRIRQKDLIQELIEELRSDQ